MEVTGSNDEGRSGTSDISNLENNTTTSIDESCWQDLLSDDEIQLSQAWLNIILARLHHYNCAFIVKVPKDGMQLRQCAALPKEADASIYKKILEKTISSPVADIHAAGDGSNNIVLSYPVFTSNRLNSIILVDLGKLEQRQLVDAMREVQWGVGLLESFFLKKHALQQQFRTERLHTCLELTLSTLDQESFLGACQTLTTEIAAKLGAQRVSIGVVTGKHIDIVAISHTAKFSEEANYVRLIATAMDEAVDQHNMVLLPENENINSAPITLVNKKLLNSSASNALCTVPFHKDEEFSGGISIEFDQIEALTGEKIAIIELISVMLAPLLHLYKENDKTIYERFKDNLYKQGQKVFGQGHVMLKLLTSAMIVLVLCLIFIQGEFRITADARLQGEIVRVAVAPFNGYIKSAAHRAGDIVEENQVLARLDDNELVLELQKWTAKQQQMLRRLREARAEQDNAEVRILSSQIEEAQAEINLLQQKINRTTINSPFAGYVISGDLSQSLGSPVQRGDVLFEVAPLDRYRVIARVDERDIRHIKTGQTGVLLLKGMPDNPVDLIIVKITPVASAEEGVNAFEIEASFDSSEVTLLPGMEGVAKFSAGEQSLLWILTRRTVNWLRLWVWSWWP